MQLLVRAAYEGALSYPLIPDPENLHHMTPEVLANFVQQNYTGSVTLRSMLRLMGAACLGSSAFWVEGCCAGEDAQPRVASTIVASASYHVLHAMPACWQLVWAARSSSVCALSSPFQCLACCRTLLLINKNIYPRSRPPSPPAPTPPLHVCLCLQESG